MDDASAIQAMIFITFAADMLHFNGAAVIDNENEPVPAPSAPDVVQLLEMRLKYERR